jgi:arsenate reductase (glutaredoxin)
MITLYGIPNCDTVKKARTWLAAAGIAHVFHDVRRDGLDPALLAGWVARAGWETVLNRAGTTFRALPDADKAGLDAARATALMQRLPAMIKRPVLVAGDTLIIGFKPDLYKGLPA